MQEVLFLTNKKKETMKPQLEIIPTNIESSINVFYYETLSFESPWHYHEQMELTYIEQSKGFRYVGNNIDNYGPGDLTLIGPSLPHTWKNSPIKKNTYNDNPISLYVQWDKEKLENLFSLKEFIKIKRMLDLSNQGIIFHKSKNLNEIVKKLYKLNILKNTDKIIQFIDILNDLSQIQEYSLLSGIGYRHLNFKSSDNRIKNILQYTTLHYGENITIEDLSNLTCMTKSSFCKYFKRRFDKTFTQYLNEFRIHSACQLLQKSNSTISEIAMDCGYENIAYFHKQFKKIINMTPSMYRKRYE